METEDIIKSNKLIAEFMGGMSHEKETSFIRGYIGLDEFNFQEKDYPETPHDGSCWKFYELKYHSSWNWLMPVVEKIEKLGYRVTIQGLNCWIDTHKGAIFGTDKKNSKRNSVYIAVVEFIKWYNQNKSK